MLEFALPPGKAELVRDAARNEILVRGSPPAQAGYLTPQAIDVWQEETGRVLAAGTGEIDSSFFACYCSLEALVRQFNAGAIIARRISDRAGRSTC